MNERERNRHDFPIAAQVMDEFRGVFGPGVKLRWWSENGKTIGNVPDEFLESGGKNGKDQEHQAGVPAIG